MVVVDRMALWLFSVSASPVLLFMALEVARRVVGKGKMM